MSIEFLLQLLGGAGLMVLALLAAYAGWCAFEEWQWDLRRRKE